MLPPPSPSLGRGHSAIILLMVDRGTDNSCRPSFALVFSPRRRYVFRTRRCLRVHTHQRSKAGVPVASARIPDRTARARRSGTFVMVPNRSAPSPFWGTRRRVPKARSGVLAPRPCGLCEDPRPLGPGPDFLEA